MEIKYELTYHLNTNKFIYSFDGETITVSYDGEIDTFDFTNFQDGSLTFEDIETTLKYNPILQAVKENGILTVTLIDFVKREKENG